MVTTRVRNADGTVDNYFFPYSRAIHCIAIRTEEILKAALMRIAKEIDPNWLKLEVAFSEVDDRAYELAIEQGRLEISFSPNRAVLNGPLSGNVDLLTHERMQDPDVKTLLMLYSTRKPKGFTLYNERHRIELIPGRTEVGYEHCESGVVYSVESEDRFTVFITEDHSRRLREDRLETLRSNLDLKHANDPPEDYFVDTSWLTFTSMQYLSQPVALPRGEDLPLETEEHREAQRRQWERTRFDIFRRGGSDR
jgi:hypothetical protein